MKNQCGGIEEKSENVQRREISSRLMSIVNSGNSDISSKNQQAAASAIIGVALMSGGIGVAAAWRMAARRKLGMAASKWQSINEHENKTFS